ncbi:unnamed protein product [Prunus armeniaca]
MKLPQLDPCGNNQTASASPTSAESWKHDVFLSFRGEDTRRGFISHLDRALAYWQAMKTFKHDRDIEVGPISPELLTAIEQSHLGIIVLSPNYASSTWCLDELSKILECIQEQDTRILPIFYNVDPSDLRNQRGSFAEAFTKHEERYSEDVKKVNRWRAALRKVANLSEWDSKNYRSEAELVEEIVKCVWKEVHPTFMLSGSLENLVGIDFALKQLRLHLAPEENDVRFIGIWGMGGVGKTTLANLVFQKISHHFEHSRFLSDVRKKKLSALQTQILFPILKGDHIWDEWEGTFFIKKYLCNKKVLLILDDADQLSQLEKLVGEKNWFGVGSRIIITTRNERLLVQHGTMSHKVDVLNDDEALELFCQHAFKNDQPEEGFQELSQHFLHYAKGLPLALKILGRSLYGRDQDVWKSALYNLNKIPEPEIFDSLKVSYYGLKEMEKKIFLHVACLHRGRDKEQVIETLDSILDISSRIGIDILVETSLLTVEKLHSQGNSVEMHDLIQEMAWRIVREESPEEPGKRSLLWCRNDIFHAFMNNTVTEAIEGIALRLPELEVVHWNCTEAFDKMQGLRFLEFDNVMISSAPKVLPNSLRIIRWNWYPSKSLPPRFEPCFLAKLEMCYSKLVRLWDGAKDFPKLKHMDLSYSDKLTSVPDFTRITNLEELILDGCTDLLEVHLSIAVHKKLKVLDLRDCTSVRTLPSELEMDSLEFFSISGCSKVNKIPEFGEQMKNLSMLGLGGTAIAQIPSSVERLVGLVELNISDCKSLLGLPSAICKLNSLKTLRMLGCSKVDKLSGEMECLENLDLRGTAMRDPLLVMKNLKRLSFSGSVAKPSTCIGNGIAAWGLVLSSLHHLCSLTKLDMSDCNIGEGAIPDGIGNLSSLRWLLLCGNNFVSLPASIRLLSNLDCLELQRCKRLEQLPDLPSNSFLYVDVNDCTSLKRLSDPSKSSGGANVYDFIFTCLNCFSLVEEEGWINRIFAMIMRLASEGLYPMWTGNLIVCPGSEIPDWFENPSVGDSITMELPLPPQPCSDWVGIALCVVFEDSEYLQNSDTLLDYDFLKIECLSGAHETLTVGHLESQHLWHFYLPRDDIKHQIQLKGKEDGLCSHCFSFKSHYRLKGSPDKFLETSSIMKKCGARLVFERDLEEFSRILKIPKPVLLDAYSSDEEAGPIGSSGSGSSDDEN